MEAWQIACAFGIPSALFVTLSGLVVKCITSCIALKRGVQVMLRSQLTQMYETWKHRPEIPMHIKTLFNDMYQQYEKLGPNGVMKTMYDDFMGKNTDTSNQL